jgi:hypothetical protein
MARNVTVTFSNGEQRTFANVPQDVTPEQVTARAQKDFGSLGSVSKIDGGSTGSAPQYTARDLSAVSPDQARSSYRDQRRQIAERYTGAQRTRALAAYDAHPASVELRNIAAGRPVSRDTPAMDVRNVNAPRTREERRDFLRSEGRQIAAARRVSERDPVAGIRGEVAGLGQGMFGVGPRIEAAVDKLTGSTPLSYRDQVEVRRGMGESDQKADPLGALGGNIAGALVGGGAAARGVQLGGQALARAPGVLGSAGNVLQNLAGYEGATRGTRATIGATVGRHARNVGRMATGGAAAGALQAVGEGSDNVAQQTALGAVAGPVGGIAIRGAGKALGAAGRALSSTERKTERALASLIEENATSLTARQRQMSRAVGREVPIVAALKPSDFREVVERVVKRNDRTSEITQGHAAGQVRDFMGLMANHVANASRSAPRAARDFLEGVEGAGATQTSRGTLDAYRTQVMDKAMEGIKDVDIDISKAADDEVIRDAISEIGRRTLSLRKEIRDVLSRTAQDDVAEAWGLGGAATRLTLREVDDLRRALNAAGRSAENSNPANALAYTNAAKALEDVAGDAAPGYREALEGFAANSRVIEGFEAASKGQRVDDLPSGQMRRNLESEEGRIGRTLGELFRQREAATKGLSSSITATQRLAERGNLTRPMPQVAGGAGGRAGTVTENVGPQASTRLANAAEVEDTVLNRMLDGEKLQARLRANQEDAISTTDLLYGAALSTALPITKVRFLARIVGAGQGRMNPKVAENIADMLFSRDAAQIRQGMNALRAVGIDEGQVRRALGSSMTSGAAASALGRDPVPTSGISVEDRSTGEVVDVPAPDEEVVEDFEIAPPDTAAQAVDSPYHGQVVELYQTMNPEYLDLVNRMLGQESAMRQFDSSGNPLTSKAGAVGIAQVMPATGPEAAQDAGLPWDEEAYYSDPAYNLLIGAAYLGKLLDRYEGDVAKALAAYNGGMGRVDTALQGGDAWLDRMPAETQNYVANVA